MAIETRALPDRLEGIQVLRGLAAAAVSWHHALETSKGVGYSITPPDWLILLGAAGVDVFFVISGFIMVFICARRADVGRPGSPARFLNNRFKRIYPLYWVCCGVFLVAIAAGFFSEKVLAPSDIAASLLLWPSEPRIIGISWTLSYEMYFYLVFALSLLMRDLRAAVCAAAVAIVILTATTRLTLGADAFLASPIVLEFVFGMIVGLAYVQGRLRQRWLASPLVLLLAIAGFVWSSVYFYADTTHHLPGHVRFLAWGLPAILLVCFGLNVRLPQNGLGRMAVASGDASYATYLFHPIVLIVYAKAFELVPALTAMSQWIWVPLATIGCLFTGWVIHRLIEKPLMKAMKGTAMQRAPA